MTILFASVETARKRGERYRVWLNGVEQRRVIEADVAAGEVLLQSVDARGRIFLRGDCVATERRAGRVRIEKIE